MKNKFLLLFICLTIMACSPFRGSVKKGTSKLFETFYIGEKGTQYFIKPLFLEDVAKNKMSIDFTFIYNGKVAVTDSATLNFSVFLPKARKAEKLTLKTENISKTSGQITKIFKDVNQIRFSTRVSLSDLKIFLMAKQPSILFDKEYFPKKSTVKKMHKIKNGVFY